MSESSLSSDYNNYSSSVDDELSGIKVSGTRISERNVENNGRYDHLLRKVLLVSFVVILLLFVMGILTVTIIVGVTRSQHNIFTPQQKSLTRSSENKNVHSHKYLCVDKSTQESRTFESKKEINEYSLFPVEHDVDVYPMLFDHNEQSSHLSSDRDKFGSDLKEYLCVCDLEEVYDYFSEDIDRRRSIRSGNDNQYYYSTESEQSQQEQQRRSVGVSSGLIVAGAVSVLMLLYKTSEVPLRIYALDEPQARDIASRTLSTRIISEIDPSTTSSSPSNSHVASSDYGNPYWDEMKEDCEKCDKFRFRKLENENRRMKDRLGRLEEKVRELTGCQEKRKEDSEFQESDELNELTPSLKEPRVIEDEEEDDDELIQRIQGLKQRFEEVYGADGHIVTNDETLQAFENRPNVSDYTNNLLLCEAECEEEKRGLHDALVVNCLMFDWEGNELFPRNKKGNSGGETTYSVATFGLEGQCDVKYGYFLDFPTFKCNDANLLPDVSYFTKQEIYKKPQTGDKRFSHILEAFNDVCQGLHIPSCYDLYEEYMKHYPSKGVKKIDL